ncbi:hypothetical protein MNBD_ALPHA09-1030 [hydrothermal vent metagenome]|uniref:EF-hand domain-containing protein n=1 Tax=hydrothermal vent metagenome TaxID=652676 RepID=A0A3B0SYB5_9ZZZZ
MKKLTAIALATGLALSGAGLYSVVANAHGDGFGMGQGYGGKSGAKHRGMGGGMGEYGKGQGGDMSGGMGMGGGMSGGKMGMSGGKMGMGFFKRLDANNDGAVTMEEALEAKPRGQGMMKHLDTDNNGEITAAEIDAMLAEKRDRMLEHLDINKDGKIDKADHTARVEQRFARFDTDKDGKVTAKEFGDVMGEWRQQRRKGMRQMWRDFMGGGAQ